MTLSLIILNFFQLDQVYSQIRGYAGVYVVRAYSDALFTPTAAGRRKRAAGGFAVAEAEIWVRKAEAVFLDVSTVCHDPQTGV